MVKKHAMRNHLASSRGRAREGNPPRSDRKMDCAETASTWLAEDPIYLDTETTGLESHDEVVEIGIVDSDGTPLMDQLVKPTVPIPKETSDIHGITNADVAYAPRWDEVHDRFVEVVRDRTIIVYNRQYDLPKLKTTIRARGRSVPGYDEIHCAMKLYARWHGDWSNYHNSYTWQKLADAADEFDLSFDGNQHRAFEDANVTRQMIEAMAERSV